jgi:uncharacterized damage-inducible protein DinB
LRAHGFETVPAVAANGEIVSGGVLEEIARVVGFPYDPPQILPPAVLMERWYGILDTAARLIRQIPLDKMTVTSPVDANRTLYALSWHVVTIGRVFLLVYEEVEARVPRVESIKTGEDLGAYADETRALLRQWWTEVGIHDPLERVVESYQGIQSLLEYLERETWHTAQHTRQVAAMLEQMGITPDRPLTPALLEGLPLPERIWD